jgi:hypothetical protein
LIEINIIGPENINVFTLINRIIINSYQNLQILIQIRIKKSDRTKRIIQIKKRLIIPARSITIIPILIREKTKLLKIRNFMFEPISFDIIKLKNEMTAAIINAYIIYVEIWNITNKPIIINRKKYLEIIEKYGIEEYYLITKKSRSLVIGRMSWARKILIMDILAFAAANLATTSPDSATTITEINILKEIITDFGIIVYKNIATRQRFIQIIKIYPDLWKKLNNIINIPEDQ